MCSSDLVTFRHRIFNIRRVLEFSEVLKKGDYNTLYKWDVRSDKIKGVAKMTRLAELLSLYAGMEEKEIEEDVEEKTAVLNWMVKNDYENVDQVGKIVSSYYTDPEEVMRAVKKNAKWSF